jgi:alpha-1,6-mannosyltransferase
LIKITLLVGEYATLVFFKKKYNPRVAAWWALNPLAIVEVVGNCHFEGLMVLGMLLTFNCLEKKQTLRAGLWWAAAIAVKLLPLLFVPVLWAGLDWRRGGRFLVGLGGGLLLMFAPMLDLEVLRHMGASVHLYFRHFEFNASAHYLARFGANALLDREMGHTVSVLMGGLTVLLTLGVSAWVAWRRVRDVRVLHRAVAACALVYLTNATTVHPWYVLVPLGLCLPLGWRWVVLWSGMVLLSYSHYAGGVFGEKFGLIALEYAVVWGVLGWELYRFFFKKSASPVVGSTERG